jgi:hypothetical protein
MTLISFYKMRCDNCQAHLYWQGSEVFATRHLAREAERSAGWTHEPPGESRAARNPDNKIRTWCKFCTATRREAGL